MFRNRIRLAVAAIAVSVMTAGAALGGFAMQQAEPTSVAVVDMQVVFSSLREQTQIQAEMRSRTEQLQQEEQQRRQNIEGLQSDLQMFAPGNPSYQEKEQELQRAVIELQTWTQFEQQQLQQARARQVEQLYKKALDAVGRIAQDNGYDIVLFKESEVDFSGAEPQQLSTLIQVRKVLWSTDQIDLTDQIIQRMNNEYENQG